MALSGVAVGVACEGSPSLPDLMGRYAAAGGRSLVCPICFNAKKFDVAQLVDNAELGGTVPLWEWISDDDATTFSYWRPATSRRRVHRWCHHRPSVTSLPGVIGRPCRGGTLKGSRKLRTAALKVSGDSG